MPRARQTWSMDQQAPPRAVKRRQPLRAALVTAMTVTAALLSPIASAAADTGPTCGGASNPSTTALMCADSLVQQATGLIETQLTSTGGVTVPDPIVVQTSVFDLVDQAVQQADSCLSGADPTCASISQVVLQQAQSLESTVLACANGTNDTCNEAIFLTNSEIETALAAAQECADGQNDTCSGAFDTASQTLADTVSCVVGPVEPNSLSNLPVPNTVIGSGPPPGLSCEDVKGLALQAVSTGLAVAQSCTGSSDSPCQQLVAAAEVVASTGLEAVQGCLTGVVSCSPWCLLVNCKTIYGLLGTVQAIIYDQASVVYPDYCANSVLTTLQNYALSLSALTETSGVGPPDVTDALDALGQVLSLGAPDTVPDLNADADTIVGNADGDMVGDDQTGGAIGDTVAQASTPPLQPYVAILQAQWATLKGIAEMVRTGSPIPIGQPSVVYHYVDCTLVTGQPNAPASLSATAGISKVKLTWPASDPNGLTVHSYTIQREDGSRVTCYGKTPCVISAGSQASFALTLSARPGVQYQFRVYATNAWGNSRYTSSNVVVPLAPPPPASPSIRTQIADLAASQDQYGADVVETPLGSNCNPYTAYWGRGSTSGTGDNGGSFTCASGTRSEQWCADFSQWAWAKSGVDTHGINALASSFYSWGQANGTWHYASSGYIPKPGDAAVWQHQTSSGNWVSDHVAIIAAVDSSGAVTAVSGNGGPGQTTNYGQANVHVWADLPTDPRDLRVDGYAIYGYASPVRSDGSTVTSSLLLDSAPDPFAVAGQDAGL